MEELCDKFYDSSVKTDEEIIQILTEIYEKELTTEADIYNIIPKIYKIVFVLLKNNKIDENLKLKLSVFIENIYDPDIEIKQMHDLVLFSKDIIQTILNNKTFKK